MKFLSGLLTFSFLAGTMSSISCSATTIYEDPYRRDYRSNTSAMLAGNYNEGLIVQPGYGEIAKSNNLQQSLEGLYLDGSVNSRGGTASPNSALSGVIAQQPMANGNVGGTFSAVRQAKPVNYASSGAELQYLLSSGVRDSDGTLYIKLSSDIRVTADLNLSNGACIDLNGHCMFIGPKASIVTGKKTLVGTKAEQFWVEGKDVWRSKTKYSDNGHRHGHGYGRSSSTEYYKEHIPGHYETKYTDVFSYDDSYTAKIVGGTIEGLPSEGMEASVNAYWRSEANGKNGHSKDALIKVLSGNLIVGDLRVKANDGGRGGDATYSAIWHVPFGGGDGGNGGNGGNGADVFFVEVGHGRVLDEGNCRFEPGEGGEGGRGSTPNPHSWILRGSTGRDGKKGNKGRVINDRSSLMT